MDCEGKLHVYTGDGKGKTSSAAGLCARALGAGLKVAFFQFIKDGTSPEFATLSMQKGFKLFPCGHGRFVKGRPSPEDIKSAKEGLTKAADVLASGKYDLVILDEANCAVKAGLIEEAELLAALKGRHKGTEAVATGRGATERLLEMADLVTEMKCVKHYFKDGRKAVKGIEF